MKLQTILFIALSILTADAFGCVCSDLNFSPSVESKYLDETNYQILTGKVLDIEVSTMPLYKDTTDLTDDQKKKKRVYHLATIVITKNYGGAITADTIDIATGAMPNLDCGFPFERNEEYLIILTAKEPDQEYFWTNICLPTKEIARAKGDIEFIEKRKG